MIHKFKATITQVYNPVCRANRGEILNCVEDPEAECIWNRDDKDDGDDDKPLGASIQKEPKHCDMDEFIKSLETPLTNAQAQMVADLFRSHCCMLEWQAQVSMLLGKLATELDPWAYLAILQTTSNLLHQVTLPPAIVMKLEAPPAQKKMTRNE